MQNIQKPHNEDVDGRLYAWFLEQKARGEPFTDTTFTEKAMQLSKDIGRSTFTATYNWLWDFKKRHGISCRDVDSTGNINPYAAIYVKEEVCVKDVVCPDPIVSMDSATVKTTATTTVAINAMAGGSTIIALRDAPATVNSMAGSNAISGTHAAANVNATPYLNPPMYINPQTYTNTPMFMNTRPYTGGPVTYGSLTVDAKAATGVNPAMNVGIPAYMDTAAGINPAMNITSPGYINTASSMNATANVNVRTNVHAGAYVNSATSVEPIVETKPRSVENMVEETSATTESEGQQFLKNFTRRIKNEKIAYKNIYYARNTALAWKEFPNKLLERCATKQKRERKFRKERVTVYLCVNASGSHKLAPLFVHKDENPKALKHCKDRLSVLFKNQPQAAMDRAIFTDWYNNHFKSTVKILQFPDGRGKVLLLLDNYQRQCLLLPKEFGNDDNFEIVFLPPSAVSLVQSLNQEVIEGTKTSYRMKMLRRVLDFPGDVRKFYFDFDLKDCMDLFSEAWTEMTVASVQNAWASIVKQIPVASPIKEEPEDPLEPNLQDIIGIITGEQEPEETVNEFLLRCEDTERNFFEDEMQEENDEEKEEDEDDEEEGSKDEDMTPSQDDIKRAFETLTIWSKQHPQYIQLQVEYLKNYYESNINNK